MTWADIDLDEGNVRIHRQLARRKRGETAQLVPLKTARREGGCLERVIELTPDLVAHLKRRKRDAFASGPARPEDFVFCTEAGGPLYFHNVPRDLSTAADKAGLNGEDLQTILRLYARDFETAKRGTSIVVYWPLELQSGWCDLVKALAVTLATKVPICFGLPPPHGEPKTLHQNSAT